MENKSGLLENLSISLFKNLPPEEITQISKNSTVKYFKKNEIIINQGDVDQLVYVIIDGSVSVTRKDDTLKKIIELAVLGPEAVVGEISVITKKPKSATITALVDTTTLMIDFTQLENNPAIKEIHGKLLINLADEMAKKLANFSIGKKTAALEDQVFDDKYTEIPNSILLLFGWKWKDIINEAPFLAAHGYDAIKIFPPQEFAVISGHPWYELYQPVAYHLSSFYGTEDDFRAMVDICHTYGIKVYADLVMNHMATCDPNADKNIGTNGTKFSKYHYGPLNKDGDYYEHDDFHHFGHEDNPDIQPEDYGPFERTWQVEHFSLNSMPKLNFYNAHVIEILRKYINYLLYLGVDGFRIDAAKHISADALVKILHNLKTRDGLNPFIYLEYYANFPMGIDPYSFMEKYFKIGYATSFCYSEFLTEAIKGTNNNNLEKLVRYSFGSSWVNYPENRAVVLLDNHDTERAMPHLLNYKNSRNNSYVLAYIFMLTWPFGVPKIMSGFRFSNFQDPIPQTSTWQNGRSINFDAHCPWVGQHRWRAISNMVLFRKKTQDAKGISHVWANGDQVAFARTYQKPHKYVATVGFVVINNSAETLQHKFETGLPAGNYFDLIRSDLINGKMNGPTIKAEDYGFAEITVLPYDAVVISVYFTT